MIFGKAPERVDGALLARVDAQAAQIDALLDEVRALRTTVGALGRELLDTGRLDPARHPWPELVAAADQDQVAAFAPLRAGFLAPVASAPPEEPGLRLACPSCQTVVGVPPGGSARCWYCGVEVHG